MSRHYSASNQPSLWGSWAVAASWEPTVASRGEFLPTQAAQSAKRASKAVQILDRLRQGPQTTRTLMVLTPAYSQRMGDLKELGYRIEREDFVDETGEWSRYTLVGEPE